MAIARWIVALIVTTRPRRVFTAHQIYTSPLTSTILPKYLLNKEPTDHSREQPVIPQFSTPFALAPGSAQRADDGTPLGRTHIFDEKSGAPILPTVRGYSGRGFLGLRDGSRSEPPYETKQDCGLADRQDNTVGEPLIEEARITPQRIGYIEPGFQASVAQGTG